MLISGFIINDIAGYYRGMIGWRWIYKYGSLLSNFLFLSSILWSLINSILIVKDPKPNWKENTIWTIISLIPILYIVFAMFAWSYEM
jgi:hypothetical protein